jgi:hypothetical protein
LQKKPNKVNYKIDPNASFRDAELKNFPQNTDLKTTVTFKLHVKPGTAKTVIYLSAYQSNHPNIFL